MEEIFFETALDVLKEETKQRSIITLCRKLDSALGGGIPSGIITEFCGPPGSGKTQFCIQLCVNVQIPKSIGGVGGKAIFIDTSQGFNPYRVEEIATSVTKRYSEIFKNSVKSSSEAVFDTDSMLSGITYYYCRDHFELLAAILMLKHNLKSQENVKLIVIDSICFPYRILEDHINRTRMLQELTTDLLMIADSHKIAVVLTNDLTTRINEKGDKYLYPALGDSHGHKIGMRIMLGRKPEESDLFVAYLNKTIFSAPEYFAFKITQNGIRGAE